MIESTKECTRCHRNLPTKEYRKQSKNKDGLQYVCKTCSSLVAATRYSSKTEQIKTQVAAARDPAKYRDYMRGYMKAKRNGTQEEAKSQGV